LWRAADSGRMGRPSATPLTCEFWNFGARCCNSIPCSKNRVHCHTPFRGRPEKSVGIANSVLHKCLNSRRMGQVPQFAPRRSCLGAGFVAAADSSTALRVADVDHFRLRKSSRFSRRRQVSAEDARLFAPPPSLPQVAVRQCWAGHSTCWERSPVLFVLPRDRMNKTLWRTSFFEFCPGEFGISGRKSFGCRMLQSYPRMKHRLLETIAFVLSAAIPPIRREIKAARSATADRIGPANCSRGSGPLFRSLSRCSSAIAWHPNTCTRTPAPDRPQRTATAGQKPTANREQQLFTCQRTFVKKHSAVATEGGIASDSVNWLRAARGLLICTVVVADRAANFNNYFWPGRFHRGGWKSPGSFRVESRELMAKS
jgi:hypothetical protein